ncbi:MAG: hypothetical protein ACREX4_13320 [Gammaproteobacteria bacterium]
MTLADAEAIDTRRVIVRSDRLNGLAVGDAVLWLPHADNGPQWLRLARLDGILLGTYRFQRTPVPDWLVHTPAVLSRVTDFATRTDGTVVTVQSRRLGT